MSASRTHKRVLACGHEGDPRSKVCRTCFEGPLREVNFICPDCSGKKSRNAEVCRPCRAKRDTIMRPCQDCGHAFPAKLRSAKTLRCRPCADLWKQNRPKPRCTIEGCNEPQRKWKRCGKHAVMYYRALHGRTDLKNPVKRNVGQMPCARCGWHEASVDVDRAIPELGYVTGNMIPLCPNCHRLVTFGLVSRPDIRL